MEKQNLVRRLPPGFRFEPTDEELVFQYLQAKIFSSQLPSLMIPEIEVRKYDPWDLPGNCDEAERYFFTRKEARYRTGKLNSMNRTTKSGHWRVTGADKIVSSSTSNSIVGIRKRLVFYKGKSASGSRTDWFMFEYRLLNVETTASNSSHQNGGNEIGDWVVCHVSMKKRNTE